VNKLNTLNNILPMVAILRGVKPAEVLDIADVLIEVGFQAIEVPLNSPQPLDSIALLAEKYGKEYLIGAGTVTSVKQVNEIHARGGRLVVSPNTNRELFKALGSVLPKGIAMYAVGGVDHSNMQEYRQYGIDGFGFGSSLYKAGKTAEAVKKSAEQCMQAYKALQ